MVYATKRQQYFYWCSYISLAKFGEQRCPDIIPNDQ